MEVQKRTYEYGSSLLVNDSANCAATRAVVLGLHSQIVNVHSVLRQILRFRSHTQLDQS